ncbi:acyltransferase [Pseudanabaena sp. PCC 6802]|uniref:acyltransferase n=1 Tax=Pseudanabaena sp. PCC 6802 TaxID=118173 RepID=UPI00034A6B37|nr:acyltransferase [Pseudanabaena sp. PCC 6802]
MSRQLTNLLRAIAITLVVAIHASNSWYFGANGDVSLAHLNPVVFLDTAINQAGRFTVPLFVILSGFGLTMSETSRPFCFVGFWQRRSLRIIPPYIFFSLVSIASQPLFQSASLPDKLNHLWQVSQDGAADYHLYFLAIIIQCYIAYPLLRQIPFSTRNLALLGSFTICLFTLRWSVSLFDLFPAIAPYLSDSNHCIFWLPYFLLGMWLAKAPDWFASQVRRLASRQWGWIWAIASTIEVSEFYFAALKMGSADAAGHYGRPTVLLMTIAFLLWAMSWQYRQRSWSTHLNLSHRHREIAATIIGILGSASFSIFLTHVWVLRLISPLEVAGGIAYLFIAAIASWGIGLSIWQRVRSVKVLNLILGA